MLTKPGDVVGVGGERILNEARHRTQGRLMQHILHPGAGSAAVGQLADIALDEAEALPGLLAQPRAYLIEIELIAGGEVIQPHHLLAHGKQGLQQVGTDESGHAGDQPGGGVGGEQLTTFCKDMHLSVFL